MTSKHLTQFRRWLLASPIAEWSINYVRELTIGALRLGPIPQHIAFVMDGNRRFARNNRIETVEGHSAGFEALARILEVCYKSGVKVVTIYAFSIENFKRSKFEVDALMEMAKVKLSQLAEHGELLDRYGASVRILGRRELVRPDVLEAIDRAVEKTAHNDKAVLNVCFPYTSRDEIATAIQDTVMEYTQPIERSSSSSSSRTPFSQSQIEHKIRTQNLTSLSSEESTGSGYLESSTSSVRSTSASSRASDAPTEASMASSTTTLNHENSTTNSSSKPPKKSSSGSVKYPSPELITSETLNSHMFTATNPPLDLLIRTSGVERLSDFMLWQCHEDTEIVFLDTLWPEFDLWQFLPVLWEWQFRMQRTRALGAGRLNALTN